MKQPRKLIPVDFDLKVRKKMQLFFQNFKKTRKSIIRFSLSLRFKLTSLVEIWKLQTRQIHSDSRDRSVFFLH